MRRTLLISLVALPLIALTSLACDKKVELTFTNLTAQSRPLQLTDPEEGPVYLGTLAADGGRVRYELKVEKDILPVLVPWQAGDVSDEFTVTERTPGKLWIDIKSTYGRTRDENMEFEEETEIEIEEQPIRHETVVE